MDRPLIKSHNHSHFWVEEGIIYESYNTIRGLRYRALQEADIADTERLSEKEINAFNSANAPKLKEE